MTFLSFITSSCRYFTLMSAAFVSLVFAQPAAAQMGFVDGDFDTQGATLSGYCYFQLSNCPTGAWGGNSGLTHVPSAAWDVYSAPTGATVAFIQGSGRVDQTFTATATKRVRLTWMEADRPTYGGQTYIAYINGTAVGTFTSSTTAFQRRAGVYFDIISGSSYTVSFVGTATTDKSAFIDRVRLETIDSQVTYTYDALGRLTGVGTVGGSNDGVQSSYSYDKAGNRSSVIVTGVP